MTNDCKTCPVSTGTHKPAEAVHQIDEPQAEALRLAAELVEPIDGFQEPTMLEAAAAAELRRQHARIAELESQLEAIGAGGVEPLRKQAAAPQAVQAEVPSLAELEAELAAVKAAPAAQAVEPEFFTVFASHNGGKIALPGYSNETEKGVKDLVLHAARQEGYKGTVSGRLLELGWWIGPVFASPPEAAAPAPAAMADEGEMFEAWARTHEDAHGAFDDGSARAGWQARAALAAPQAVQAAVPDGWQMVPAKPTEAMVGAIMSEGEVDAVAGLAPELRPILLERAGIAARYTAMLAAAPAHPAEGVPAQSYVADFFREKGFYPSLAQAFAAGVAHAAAMPAQTVDEIMELADEYAGAQACAVTATSTADADTTKERNALLSAIRAALAATQPAPAIFGDEDHVLVPRGLIGAACYAIDKKRDATKTLTELRRYTTGDLSAATQPTAQDLQLDTLKLARDRLADMLEDDDGQAWKEARKAMPIIDAALAAQAKQGGAANG